MREQLLLDYRNSEEVEVRPVVIKATENTDRNNRSVRHHWAFNEWLESGKNTRKNFWWSGSVPCFITAR